jgi:hypothetical protein
MGVMVGHAFNVTAVVRMPPSHVPHRDHDEKQAADGHNAFFDFHAYNLARPRSSTMGRFPMPGPG